MDHLTDLRHIRGDITAPGADELATARNRLVSRTQSPRRRSRVPLLVVSASTVVVAAVVTAALVLSGSVTAPPATAAEVFRTAASEATSDATAGRGQYLEVQNREEFLGYVQDDDGPVVGAYRAVSVTQTYIPHDRGDVWLRRSWTEEPTTFFGGPQVRQAAARDYAQDAHADQPRIERSRGGRFGNGELGGTDGFPTDSADALPDDPRSMLRHLQQLGPDAGGPSVNALAHASTLLRNGLVPADRRRTIFEALALLDDARIVEHTVTLNGRRGTAVGVREGNLDWSLVIDPASGDYLGDLQVQLDRVGAVPAGTVTTRSTLTTSVVDHLP